jgi:hypothetical protein
MVRTVWLALVFFIGICGLAALKVSIATPAKQEAAFWDAAIEADVSQHFLSKADKLEVNSIEETPDKKLVHTIAIVPLLVAPKPEEKIIKISSRHWHEGYAKMRSQKNHRHKTSRTRQGKGSIPPLVQISPG